MLRCPDGHEADVVTPWESSGATGFQWYECLECGARVRVDVETPETILCPYGCVCGRPADEHPTQVEQLLGRAHTANAFRDPDRIDRDLPVDHPERHPVIEAPASHPEHAHAAQGDPCTQRLAMRKLIGFLCVECGLPIEGLPAKTYG
jgi:hypothetical protein